MSRHDVFSVATDAARALAALTKALRRRDARIALIEGAKLSAGLKTDRELAAHLGLTPNHLCAVKSGVHPMTAQLALRCLEISCNGS